MGSLILVGILVLVAFCIHYIMSLRTKNKLKSLVKSRKPTSLEEFCDYFPGKDFKGLEVIYFQLQDMLSVGGKEAFPINPSDDIYKTYRIHKSELKEMLTLVSEECGISYRNLTAFFNRKEKTTVRDLVNLLRDQK